MQLGKRITAIGLMLAIPLFMGFCDGVRKVRMNDRSHLWKTEKMKLLDSEEFSTSLVKAIEREKGKEEPKNYPLTEEKLKEFTQELIKILILEQGSQLDGINAAQAETIFAALGAMIGFSSQIVIHEAFIATGKVTDQQAFIIITDIHRKKYYYGDSINWLLMESTDSNPWSTLSSAATTLGAKNPPDIREIAGYTASSLGHDTFGIPRLPKEHQLQSTPQELLNKYWNPVRTMMLLQAPNARNWPEILTLVALALMIEAKDIIPPEVALKIIFESAIPMAHIDPNEIYRGLVFRKDLAPPHTPLH